MPTAIQAHGCVFDVVGAPEKLATASMSSGFLDSSLKRIIERCRSDRRFEAASADREGGP